MAASENFPLHDAALRNDVDELQKLICAGIAVNCKDDSLGRTSLHYAAISGAVDFIRILLENGADINISDNNGNCAIHLASAVNHHRAVNLLLECGAEKNKHNNQGETPLLLAVKSNSVEVTRELLKCQTHMPDNDDNNILHIAAVGNCVEMIKILLDHGIDINGKDKWGRTSLLCAAQKGSIDAVKMLLKGNSDLTMTDNGGHNILHRVCLGRQREMFKQFDSAMGISSRLKFSSDAKGNLQVTDKQSDVTIPVPISGNMGDVFKSFVAQDGSFDPWKPVREVYPDMDLEESFCPAGYENNNMEEIIKLLVSYGADINKKNLLGLTPLMVSVICSTDTAKVLIECKADLHITDNFGNNSLHLAAMINQPNIIKLLLEHRTDINRRNKKGHTPLFLAACNGSLDSLKMLLENKADSLITDNNGNSILHAAATNNHGETIKLLLDCGIDIDGENKLGHTPLFLAACKGSLDSLKMLLENKADLFITDNNDNSILHAAATNNHGETIKLLLDCGIDINGKNKLGLTPLMMASQFGTSESVKTLLERKADFNIADIMGSNSLHIAVLHGQIDVIKLLIDHKVDVNKETIFTVTPLTIAVFMTLKDKLMAALQDLKTINFWELVKTFIPSSTQTVEFDRQRAEDWCRKEMGPRNIGYLCDIYHHIKWPERIQYDICTVVNNVKFVGIFDVLGEQLSLSPIVEGLSKDWLNIIKLLIESGADINHAAKLSVTPLLLAVTYNAVDVVELLLQYNVDVNKKSAEIAPIHSASMFECPEVLKLLIKNGANVNDTDDDGSTPLHCAAWYGSTEAVLILLDHKADINRKDTYGYTPFLIAAGINHYVMMQHLMANGADIFCRSDDGLTVLHFVAWNGANDVLDNLLCIDGFDLNVRDNSGDSPLHEAALNGHWDTVNLLIDKGVEINMSGHQDKTCLHYAAEQGNTTEVETLMKGGASIQAKNSIGNTPVFSAASFNHLDCLKCFFEHYPELEINSRGHAEQTLLHIAASCRNEEMVKYLLEHEADVNAKDLEEMTPLHRSVWSKNSNIINKLLEAGSDVNVKDKIGRTPLHVTAANGDLETVEILLRFKAEVACVDGKGDMALHLAFKGKYLEIVKVLVKHGASGDVLDSRGKSPLDTALFNQRSYWVLILLGKDVQKDEKAKINKFPLHYVIEKNYYDALEYLLSRKVDFRIRENVTGNNAFHAASMKSSRAVHIMVNQFRNYRPVQVKSIINAENKDGNTPLHLAAFHCDEEAVRDILRCGKIDLNIQNKKGQCQIHMAVLSAKLNSVEELLDSGCDLHRPDNKGDTPLHNALQSIVDIRGNNDKSPTRVSSKEQTTETLRDIARTLVYHGANIFAMNAAGMEAIKLLDTSLEIKFVKKLKLLQKEREAISSSGYVGLNMSEK